MPNKEYYPVIQDDMLIREFPIGGASDSIVGIKRECVITKDEFIACYNKWIKPTEDTQNDIKRLEDQ